MAHNLTISLFSLLLLDQDYVFSHTPLLVKDHSVFRNISLKTESVIVLVVVAEYFIFKDFNWCNKILCSFWICYFFHIIRSLITVLDSAWICKSILPLVYAKAWKNRTEAYFVSGLIFQWSPGAENWSVICCEPSQATADTFQMRKPTLK